jgi:hypothetical protein
MNVLVGFPFSSKLFNTMSTVEKYAVIIKEMPSLETFTEWKKPRENLYYRMQKQNTLSGLHDDMIDKPIVNLIRGLNRLPFCFTLQCCYGHFVYKGQKDAHNLDPLPEKEIITKIEYRIAYIAFCIDNSAPGKELVEVFMGITDMDPDNIQFGCAEWFWKRQINSYVVQVEPDRFKHQDTVILDFPESCHVENVRNAFFFRLNGLIENG